MTTTNASNDSIDALCNHCGKTFSTFLHQMADHNAKVICPECRLHYDKAATSSQNQEKPKHRTKKVI